MADFLLELRSEEIPARMQARARADLETLFVDRLADAGLKPAAVETYATPRRLALVARDLPDATEATREERKGPKADAPEKALEGFLRSTGLTRDRLEEREDAKGNRVLFAVIDKPGRATTDVLAEAVPALVRAFPWPKSMRWGHPSTTTESLRWVRPLQGIVALFGEDVVPCEIDGIASGGQTVGHRFHHPGRITIGGAHDYAQKLRACHVIVDQEERAAIIARGASEAAADAGLDLVDDSGLLAENAGLTEWPVPLLGRFDEAFLDVPPEVIQLTARVNQKYFVCRDGRGALANAFVCVANIDASDGGERIVAGNEKVLAARLSDARFFWEQDRKVPLEAQAKKLERIVFHEKLGTVADKVDRVATLARWLVEQGIVGAGGQRATLAAQAERAARLAKADLVTEMVGEFPELQGLMGGYYARAQGEDEAVWKAVRDHYKPVGQNDAVPTDPVTVAVGLADRIDTVVGFFAIDQKPTGSKDPFALRRATLQIIASVLSNDVRLGLSDVVRQGRHGFAVPGEEGMLEPSLVPADVLDFFADRLKVQQREAGVRHDLIDAVFALGGEDDLVRLLARVAALQAFVDTEDGANLLAGYKRAANILKKEGVASLSPGKDAPGDAPGDIPPLSYDPEPAEADLIAALDAAEPEAARAVAAEEFEAAMRALASLRQPIDRFFDSVTVNDADPARRTARLALLARMRAAVHKVADFSKIEG